MAATQSQAKVANRSSEKKPNSTRAGTLRCVKRDKLVGKIGKWVKVFSIYLSVAAMQVISISSASTQKLQRDLKYKSKLLNVFEFLLKLFHIFIAYLLGICILSVNYKFTKELN